MRLLIVLLLTTICLSLQAQILTQSTAELAPTEAYENVNITTLHDDENTTVFMISIKKSVRRHLHEYHTEIVTVLEGRGKMYFAGKYLDIRKGDQIIIPPNTPHGVVTTSSQPLQVMSVQTPQFLGYDRVFLPEETPEEQAAKAKKEKKKKVKKKKKEDDIPEFEGEFD
jgi:mannose-6-phosphate isomerase-like protein (cupin superfamily)